MRSRVTIALTVAVALFAVSNQSFAIPLRVTNVAVGTFHTCASLSNGQLKCWGFNSAGTLGLGDRVTRGRTPDSMGDSLPAVDLGVNEQIVNISLGYNFSCVQLVSGLVKCWGNSIRVNTNGNRFVGDEPGEMGASLASFKGANENDIFNVVSTNTYGLCLLSSTPMVECYTVSYPSGRLYDLGEGFRPVVQVILSSGGDDCAINAIGRLKCWGLNDKGQLGQEDLRNRFAASEIGDSLPTVNLGEGLAVLKATGGNGFHCALLSNQRVKCWGRNAVGELGIGSDAPTRGGAAGEMGDALPAVDLGETFRAADIGSGDFYTCALSDEGRIKCWGDNRFGQLGLGDNRDRGARSSDMGEHLPEVDLGGIPAVAIGVGANHACAILSNGGLKCWGSNLYGQLGLEDGLNRGDDNSEMGTDLPIVRLWD